MTPDGVSVGCVVEHGEFGRGVIVVFDPPFEAEIRFDDENVGVKRLHLSFAPMTVARDGVEIDYRSGLPDPFNPETYGQPLGGGESSPDGVRLRHEGILNLTSGVIAITDYPSAVELRVPAPPLPRDPGQSASVEGKHWSVGVLLDLGVARPLPIFAVHDQHGDLFGYFIWSEDSQPDGDFLREPAQVLFSEAGYFAVDSGSFRIIDQRAILGIPEGIRVDDNDFDAVPRFGTGGDGLYSVWLAYRGDDLAGVYIPVAWSNEFPPSDLLKRTELVGDPTALESFNLLEIVGADLARIDLSGKRFDRCLLRDVKLSGANLAGCSFESTIIEASEFGGANLADASFESVELRRCSFQGANLAASFDDSTLVECDLSELAAPPTFERFNYVEATKFGALENPEFTLEGALIACDFAGAQLPNAQLNGVDLTRSNFAFASLEKAKLNGSTIEETNFTDAVLRSASMRGAQCRGAVFTDADMELVQATGADFRDCDLTGVNFTNAVLRDADFTGANLDGADLRKAKLQGAKMPDGSIADPPESGK